MIEILQTDTVFDTPVYPFFLRQMAELMDNRFSWYVKTWNENNMKAVYATDNGIVVGHIVYEYKKASNSLWIVLSSVDQKYRGQGIYKRLHSQYEEIAREMGCDSISSLVHKNNKTRLATAKSVDFLPNDIVMIKRI